MTNKERLIANNEKIKEIQETLNNKILAVVGGKEIELELPSDFETLNEWDSLFYISPTNDKILVSANISNVGLWIYTISTKTWVKAHDGAYWGSFQQVTDTKWLITGGATSSVGVLLYDANTDTVTQIYDKGRAWTSFYVIGTRCLIYSQSYTGVGVLVYDSTNDSCVQTYSSGYGWNTVHPMGTDRVLLSGSSSAHLVVYNYLDNSTKLLATTIEWSYGTKVNDTKYLLANANSSTSRDGLWVYDSRDDSFTQVFVTGYRFDTFVQAGSKWLVSSFQQSAFSGIVLYDPEDNSATQIYDSGIRWKFANVVGTKCLISNVTSASGLLRCDLETGECTQIYTTGYNWEFYQNVGDKCLIGSRYGNGSGVLLYDANDDTISQLLDEGYMWKNFKVIGSKCLLSSDASNSDSYGIYLYNALDNTINKIHTSGYGWSIFMEVAGKVLIGSTLYSSGMVAYNPDNDSVVNLSNANGYKWMAPQRVTDTKIIFSGSGHPSNQGLWLFDASTDTLTRLTTLGSSYDIFVRDVNNNYYVSGTNKTRALGTFYFTEATNTLTLKKYYLGEI